MIRMHPRKKNPSQKRIGITGGIGCGKTAVAQILAEKGVEVIDADRIGKQVVEENPDVLKRLVETFGKNILHKNGTLNRKKLGAIVFAEDLKRVQLNEIVHPQLWAELEKQLDESDAPLVFVDAALIYEANVDGFLDGVIVVTADLEIRIKRIQKRDGLSRKEILNRISSQMSLEEKIARADWIIENNGDLEELRQKVNDLVRSIHK